MDFIKKYISLTGLRTEIKETSKRFRFTVIFASLLTIWLITLQNDIVRSYEAVAYSVLWTLIEGLLYSLATTIWCEYLGKKSRNNLLQFIILALVIIDCTTLILRGGVSGTGEIIARLSALLLPIMAVFFIPSAPGISRMQLERDVNINVDSIFASKSDEKQFYLTPDDSTLIIITRIVKQSTDKGQTIKYSGYEFKK